VLILGRYDLDRTGQDRAVFLVPVAKNSMGKAEECTAVRLDYESCTILEKVRL
jgi:hypothetical protein